MAATGRTAARLALAQFKLKESMSRIFFALLLVFVYAINGSAIAADSKSGAAVQNKPNTSAGAGKGANAGATTGKGSVAGSNTKGGTTSATIAKRAPAKPGSKMFMWKMSSDTGAILYLLGTIHVFRPEYYPLPVEMEKALEKSKALLVEVDANKADSKQKTQEALKRNGLYFPPEDLSKHISMPTLQILQEYCVKAKLPFADLLHFKGSIVAVEAERSELMRLGYSIQAGIDLHLMGQAVKSGKKVVSLESEELQLNVLGGLPDDQQEVFLKATLEEMPDLKVELEKLMKSWLDGNETVLVELIEKDMRKYPEYKPISEKLIYERNVTMAQKLEGYLKGPAGDVFMVAVGSGHLVGERSIIELLTKKGYKCQQVVVGDSI